MPPVCLKRLGAMAGVEQSSIHIAARTDTQGVQHQCGDVHLACDSEPVGSSHVRQKQRKEFTREERERERASMQAF